MNSSDFRSIREQLLAIKNEPNSDSGEWLSENDPRSLDLPIKGLNRSATAVSQQAEAVQALRRRSTQPTPEEEAAISTIPPNINGYLQRLRDEADKINDLYRQQEVAIQKFQRTVKGLDIILPRQAHGSGLRREQFCELRDAALTSVLQDNTGRYILTAVSVDLNADEYQASQNAAEIRAYEQHRSRSLGQESQNFLARLEDPVAAISGVWQIFSMMKNGHSQLTPLDSLVWFGGGVISRVALDIALSASPALWNWVVAAIVGAVIWGLYRLFLARRPDGTFIVHLFLALIGLWIGGQF